MRMPYWLRPRWSDFSDANTLNRDAFARTMARPLPDLQYVMFFTPRSGSSWIADVLTRTRRMGRVRESFNPHFMKSMSQGLGAASLDEYCEALPRKLQSDGVFGFQITKLQQTVMFGTNNAFLKRYGVHPWIWLVRSDIVLQAVSLYKMDVAQITHAPHLDTHDIGQQERIVIYDPDRIRYWIEHIRQIERKTEALIVRAGIQPLRLNYERNSGMKPNHIANVIGRHVGRETMVMKAIKSPHNKVGTDQNAAYAERFRQSHKIFLDWLDDERAEMLENSVCYGPKGSF
jgi:LPS sulfotransferase NodH